MSNYTKTTNFGAKDTLPSGDSQKIVRGTEFDTEFNAISTAIATKLESGASSADVNFLQSGTGATTRTVQGKLRDVVSVKDFGAVGDGVTDDSAAFAAALAVNASFLQVYIPEGTYRLSSSIVINRQNLTLTGASRSSTLYPDSGVTAINVSVANSVSNIVLRDFRIYGNTNATGGIALGGFFVAFCQIHNLSIENFLATGSFGIKLSKVQELDIYNCYIADNYNNIHFPSTAGNYATSVHIHGQGGYVGRASNIGILLDKEVSSFRVSDIVVESNNVGFACTGFSNQVSFENVHFEENDGAQAVYLSGNSSRKGQFTINNCFFYGNTVNLRADHAYITMSGNTGLVDTGLIIPQTACNLVFRNNKADDGSLADPITVYESLVSSATVSYFDVNNSGTPVQRVSNIKFPVTAVPSGDPNTLDDYEEGTWTPSLVCGTSGSITLSAANGRYTKIGNLVTVFATVVVSSVSSPTGELRLSGLPFTVGGNGDGTFSPFAYGLASGATTALVGIASATNNYAVISKYSSGGVSNLAGDIQGSAGITASFSYLVA